MKKILYTHLLIAVFCLTALLSFGQNDSIPKITRSENKVNIGGELYYVHEVEKGQTLYSISKAYNVPQKTIARENPDVFLGLHPGQVLKIPFKPTQTHTQKDTARFFYHKVRKGQTLFSLAKKYDVTPEIIKKHNPILYQEELKAKQEIKIPRKNILVQKETQIQPADTSKTYQTDERKGNVIFHRVKPQETLYALAQKYNIEVKDIKKMNQDLDKNNLQPGNLIRIPRAKDTAREFYLTERKQKQQSSSDTTYTGFTETYQRFFKCDSTNNFRNKHIKVTILLPFHISKNYEKYYIDSSEVNDKGKKIYKKIKRSPYYIYPKSENFLEFYEGILLAMDSIKKSGISIRLNTLDTKDDPLYLRNELFKTDLSDEDLIIGPIYEENFEILSDYAKKYDIDIVSPFPKKEKTLRNNSNIIQIYPTWETQLERFAAYISRFNDKNMMLVHTGDSLYYPPIQKFKEKMFYYISKDTCLSDVRFKEVAFKDSIFYLEQALNKGEENIVVIPSKKEAFVTDVVTNLNTLTNKGYDIRVFGYSQWQDFVNVDQEYFYNLHLNLFTPFHVDYSKPVVKHTVKSYRNLFKTEPSKYVFHGFDIGMYFFKAMYRFGENFRSCLHTYQPELCHSNYMFYKERPSLELENISIFVLKYHPDYTISSTIPTLFEQKTPVLQPQISDLK